MDYSWVSEIQNTLNTNSLFTYSIMGAKSLAMAFLLFRIIGQFISTSENSERPPIGGIINIIGFGLIIVGSDWIVETIELLFSGVDVSVANMNHLNTMSPASRQLQLINETAETLGPFEKIAFYFSVQNVYWGATILFIVSTALHFVDIAITSMYLLQRVFLLQLFKFLFPFAVAFSALKETQSMFWKWIKIYIGLFVLGIAYIAIIKFSVVVYGTIAGKADVDYSSILITTPFSSVFFAELGALIVAFAVKIGLMGFVTREVRNYFS